MHYDRSYFLGHQDLLSLLTKKFETQTERGYFMMKRIIIKFAMLSLSLALIVLMTKPIAIAAAGPPVPTVVLGDASSFAVLGSTTVTNTGTTSIGGTGGGNVGVYAGSSITGKASMTISGVYHEADTQAGLAQTALTAAITDARNRPATTIITELGNRVLNGGVYTSEAGTFGITGELTLDGQNNPNAVFIFQMASTLITGDASTVTLINGASACNVFWQVGSSATLGTTSNISGHILATASITANAGATINGSLLASTGAVTLSSNTITNDVCPTATKASLTIVKHVVNNDGGTLSAADFSLHVRLDGIEVTGSPAVGSETGEYYVLEPGTYVISENAVSGYVASFSGATAEGSVTLIAGDNKTVTIINNDVSNEIPNTGVEDDMILIGGLFLILSIIAWFISRRKTF
ncbi:MAG: hypothetical protein FD133_1946 [Erysipelotrichaceae bacterium]|nr:MAG: hypothetical protein FD133_1946 [Erysipelotrichaceae bacterium]